MEKNLISVITPVYNSENYLESCLFSLINQTYKNCEFILIDDFSSDASLEILNKFSILDVRIKVYSLKKNNGAAFSRNIGIHASKGEYLAFCDSDDFWHKDKVLNQLNFMMENKYFISHTNYFKFKNNNITNKIPIKSKNVVCLKDMYFINHIGFSTVMINQKVTGKIYFKNYHSNNDYAYLLNILGKYPSYLYKDYLTFYRVHEGSLSNNKIKNSMNHFIVLKNETDLNLFKVIIFFIIYIYLSFKNRLINFN